MTLRHLARVGLLASVIFAGLSVASPPAGAVFHLMKVREVYAGSATALGADFVELQMYAPGQTLVANHRVHFYALGTYGEATRQDCTIPANVANGMNQARILFATAEAQSLFAVIADFTMPAAVLADAGAVCFEGIDCVAWGSWTAPTMHLTGTPEAAIPPGQSIDRRTDIDGNPGSLSDADDTNDSANDFAPNAAPAPEGNGGPNLGALGCQNVGGGGPGPGAGATYTVQGLTARAGGDRATIKGRIDPPAPGQRVKLTFLANGSPLRRVATARVTLNDESRFRKRFRVPDESTRCKATVKFQGVLVGQKRFRC